MTAESVPTRRERLRAQALREIRDHGYAQIEQGGAASLSLNGIARAMGMSGPAMYRYVGSRDELLATLVAESYEELGDELARAVAAASPRSPRARLTAALDAYRSWALRFPHRYRLVFESTYGSGAIVPERVLPAAARMMDIVLDLFAALPGVAPPPVTDARLRADLRRWGQTTARPRAAAGLLWLGQLTWSRLHGILSLEIEGIYEQMGIDAERLYAAEVSQLAALAQGGRAARGGRGSSSAA